MSREYLFFYMAKFCYAAATTIASNHNYLLTSISYFKAIVASLTKKEILKQSSEDVGFLHRPEWKVIHQNLNLDHFLIACVDPNKDYFLIKLTDFQLSRNIEINSENTGTLNREGWVTFKSFKDSIELNNKVNVFILGCYYFYALSGGKHPW